MTRSSTSDRPDHSGLVMGYASLDDRDITRGVERLTAALEAVTAQRPSQRQAVR